MSGRGRFGTTMQSSMTTTMQRDGRRQVLRWISIDACTVKCGDDGVKALHIMIGAREALQCLHPLGVDSQLCSMPCPCATVG